MHKKRKTEKQTQNKKNSPADQWYVLDADVRIEVDINCIDSIDSVFSVLIDYFQLNWAHVSFMINWWLNEKWENVSLLYKFLYKKKQVWRVVKKNAPYFSREKKMRVNN